MKSEIRTYASVVILATFLGLFVASVSAIECVQCSSENDQFCRRAFLVPATECADPNSYCLTTVILSKFRRERIIRRSCSLYPDSGCVVKERDIICKESCSLNGCNEENYLLG